MYVKINNEGTIKFPYTIQDLKEENPNTSFPATIKQISSALLTAHQIFPVAIKEVPPHSSREVAVQNSVPELENNSWVLGWTIRPMTEEEVYDISSAYRSERDILLKDCDWTHVTDSALTEEQKVIWATYRQALRDITAQTGFPFDIVWPAKPA